jgi:hypothetical protein
MIEPVMYVAIGFLVACMLIIGIIPVVHARAVRLTTRRLEAVTWNPVTDELTFGGNGRIGCNARNLALAITERDLRKVSRIVDWRDQLRMFGRMNRFNRSLIDHQP